MKVERKKSSDSLLNKSENKNDNQSASKVHSTQKSDSTYTVKQSIFINELSSIEEIKTKEELQKVFEEVEQAGEIFKKMPTFTHLNHFKSLIQKFMNKIVKDGYKVNSITSQRIGKDDKILTTIKKIDTTLEELSEKLLNKENDAIKLAAKVDEIKGLLLDLIY